MATRIPTIPRINLMGKVKSLSLKITFQSFCVINTQRFGGLLMDRHILYDSSPRIERSKIG